MGVIDPLLGAPLAGVCGRADLLIALAVAEGVAEKEAAFASILGFVALATPPTTDIIINAKPEKLSLEPMSAGIEDRAKPRIRFRPYQLVAVESSESDSRGNTKASNDLQEGVLTQDDIGPWSDDEEAYPLPTALPIVPWARLWPRIRQALAKQFFTSLDISSLIHQLAKGLPIPRLPYIQRTSWPSALVVIFDVSDRLTPYWDDWRWLQQRLLLQLSRQTHWYRLAGMPSKLLQPLSSDGLPKGALQAWPELRKNDTLLIVSDLGWLDSGHPEPARRWHQKLTHYRARGVNIIVLAPVASRQILPEFKDKAVVLRLSPDSNLRPFQQWSTLSFSQPKKMPRLTPAAETLLSMMSIATKVEPALLRQLRSCLLENNRDVSFESEVWCYPEVDTSAIACAIAPWAVQHWRERFSQLDSKLQQRTLDCLRQWHAHLPQAIHHEETLLWRFLAKAGECEKTQAERAQHFFLKLKNTFSNSNIADKSALGLQALMVQYCDHHIRWAAPTIGNTEGGYLNSLSIAVAAMEPERIERGLPEGIDPSSWLQALPHQTIQRFNLLQQANGCLLLSPALLQIPTGSTRLATLDVDSDILFWSLGAHGEKLTYHPWEWKFSSKYPLPKLPTQLETEIEAQQQGSLPSFYLQSRQVRFCFKPMQLAQNAAAWGQDTWGLFMDLKFNQVRQRFRWIAPGTFTMGSPENEAERREDETQHLVTLTQGFWLADSVCMQALWQAVLGNNPAHFQDALDHPVEQVSWDDVQQFIQTLNTQIPDLQARLPTEAEWEYACRVGTTTPFSFGDNITPEQVNYDGNFPYFGAEKGRHREKTVPVKSLPPNPWGLYEMHGNVFEWCADWYGDYPAEAVTDPSGPIAGQGRVLRGGAWDSLAGWARSAFRTRGEPGLRYGIIGFRLALGRKPASTVSEAGETGRQGADREA